MSDTHANVLVSVIDKASGVLGNIGKAMGGIAMAAGAAAIAAGGAALKLGMDFEATMNDFKMAAGDNLGAAGLSADDFTKKFLQLGKDTKYSAQEAAEAGVELAKGGVALKDVMGDATEATLNLAAAAKSELAPTARIVAQQLGVWASEGANATETANLMAQALNASTLNNLDEFAIGLANVNGVAKGAGASQKDVIVAMAATSDGFSSATDQGTSFKTMLQMIAGPSKDAKGAMRELGLMTFDYGKAQEYLAKQGIKTDGSARQINVALDKLTKKFKMSKKDAVAFFDSFEQNQFYDSEGKFKGMRNAADILQKSLTGLSDEAKSSALKDIFGQDGIRMALALSEKGAAGFDAMDASMKKAGTAAEQAAKLNQGLAFVMESLKGSVESAGIAFALKFLPYLTSFAQTYILPLVNGFADWIDKIDIANISMGGLYTTLENALGTDAAETIMDVVVIIQTLISTLANGGNLGGFAEAIQSLTTTDLGSFVAGIATALQGAINWVTTNWPLISAAIMGAFTGVAAFVTSTVIPIGASIITAFAAAVQWVLANWPQISATIGTVISAVGFIITNVLLPQVTWLLSIFQEIVGWVTTNWPLIAKTFQDGMPLWKGILGVLAVAFVTTWEMIKASISNVITIILSLMKASMQLMQGDTQGALNTLYEMFKTIFGRILTAIKTVLSLIFPNIDETFGKIKTFLGGLPTTFYELGKNIVYGLLNSIIDFGDKVKDKIIEMIMGPLGYVKTLLGINSPSDEMIWVGSMIGAGLVMGINNSIEPVKAAMKNLHDAVVQPLVAPDVGPQGTAQMNWSGGSYNNGAGGANNVTNIDLGGVNVSSNVDANWFLRQLGETLLRHP